MKHSLELLIDFSRRRREIPPVLFHIFDPPVPRAEGDRDNYGAPALTLEEFARCSTTPPRHPRLQMAMVVGRSV